MAPTEPDELTLADAADALGVHYMTAYRYVRTGILDAHREGGRWVVAKGEVDRLRGAGRSPDLPPARRRRVDRSGRLADRMIAGDEGGCWRIVQDAQSAGADLDDVLLALLGPALRVVGDRWEAGEIGVAEEHQATVVAMRLIGRIGGSAGRRGRPRGRVLLSAAPGDRHGLPSAMVTDLLRARGWVAIDLGADAPAEEIAATAARTHRLEAVGVCATTALDRQGERELRRTVRLVREATTAPIVLGGAAIADADHATRLGADLWSETALDLVAALGSGQGLSPVGDG